MADSRSMYASATHPARTRSTAPVRLALLALAISLSLAAALTLGSAVRSAEARVNLGTADSFAILAGTTITNSGSTTIRGDIGLHDGTAFAGYDDGADSVTHLDGDLYLSDAAGVALQAKNDLATAYTDAAGRTVTKTIGTELGGKTLAGGVYDSASTTFEITDTLTLDAGGVADTVWIFKMGTSLLAATTSRVEVINGGDACNVFWQVGSSATLNGGATFAGTVMALTSIWVGSGATVDGRLLARNGEVTLVSDTVMRSDCPAIVAPTDAPTDAPTNPPTDAPTNPPTDAPTDAPTNPPTDAPTNPPTDAPTDAPANPPTNAPTDAPANPPTNAPTTAPTNPPTDAPTNAPSDAPPHAPTPARTNSPTIEPALPDTGTVPPVSGQETPPAPWLVLLLGAGAAAWFLLRPLRPVGARIGDR